MVLYETATPNNAGHRDVRPSEVAAAQARVHLVDVREPSEFDAELGHIPGARLVPLATLTGAAKNWDPHAELVLICRSGRRSFQAAVTLGAAGFTRVMNLNGGMIAWNEAGLPVERNV